MNAQTGAVPAPEPARAQLTLGARARARSLLNDLNLALDDENCRLDILLQKGIRLAEMMHEHEYKLVLQIHLDGVTGPGKEITLDPLVQTWPDKSIKERFNTFNVITEDRRVEGEEKQLVSLTADEMERKARLLEKTASEVGIQSPGVRQVLEGEMLFRGILNRIRRRVGVLARVIEKRLDQEDSEGSPPSLRTVADGGRVFIGHGHSPVWKDLASFLEHRLHLPWNEFNHETPAGLSNKEVLEHAAENACMAFLVLTAEDSHPDGQHARENVIHEAGLFQGRLGFTRGIVLLEKGCREFSNLEGTGQIRFPKGNIIAASEEVRRVLERERIIERDTSKPS